MVARSLPIFSSGRIWCCYYGDRLRWFNADHLSLGTGSRLRYLKVALAYLFSLVELGDSERSYLFVKLVNLGQFRQAGGAFDA